MMEVKYYAKRLLGQLAEQMDNYSVKKKLYILYIFCVLLPLFITDSVILTLIVRANQASHRYELQNTAEAVKHYLSNSVDNAATIANNIYMNRYINNFMNETYELPLDYYNGYLRCMQYSLFRRSIGISNYKIIMYADNPTIINGGEFARLETVAETEWYRYLIDSGSNQTLFLYYDDSSVPVTDARRKISLIRKMNFYERDGCEKILKLDMDYSGMVRDIVKMNYELPVYVCMGDKIIFSNQGYSDIGSDFHIFQEWGKIGYRVPYNIYGQELEIYVLRREQNPLQQIYENKELVVFLVCFNIFLPWLFLKVINRSFTERLRELSRAFNGIEGEKLQEIPQVRGKDEIGTLMHNYNSMVTQFNDLLQTIYKDKLKEQEMDIARQNAELLALHSQINPHFMFNALESIRMHSILKQEMETASMVEKLAVMERQYVDWERDSVTIKEEIGFAEDYLDLQKYRFGERLSYHVEVDDRFLDCRVPKLTLVTFVENACVHGIENKPTPGWIFIRIYQERDELCVEVEDTGNGMKEPLLSELKDKMENVSIDALKGKGRVGIANACLRLKMVTNDEVRFDLESEEGAGTIVTIRIPFKYTGKQA